MEYGDHYLGKKTVLCKDTPAFIANRVGVYAMSLIYQLADKADLTINEIDKLTGPAIGRPSSGTFRLSDLVGLDVAAKVTKGIQENCPEDAQAQALQLPAFFQHLVDNKWYGNKSGKGFYLKTDQKDEKGRSVIHSLNLKTLTYAPSPKSSLPSLAISKQIDELPKRLQALLESKDAGGELLRASFAGLFAYASKRVPEISDTLYAIDDALRAGFGWELGPFEYWDVIGLEQGLEMVKDAGYTAADWVTEMASSGITRFYSRQGNARLCYDPSVKNYVTIPGSMDLVKLSNFRSGPPVFKNSEIVLHDIGDQVLCLEFNSKMNAIGEGILKGVQESITIAESGDWRGLVIGNEAKNFTVGANLMLIAMLAYDEQWDDLEMAVNLFQQTSMRCRYSSIPVVAATQGYVFGGGCEMSMHCDVVCAAAESYIGQVEVGVGLIPGGAGTKEFAVRASDAFFDGDVMIPTLIEKFKTLALASVSTSAHEAFDYGYLLDTKDRVIINGSRNIDEAKQEVIRLSEEYVTPLERDDVLVLGRQGLGALYTAANELYRGHYASEHDIKIAHKIAWVLCGGDLSTPQKVTERYLLDLEREAFMQLVGEQKTMERIQYMLQNGKPLRN
jgi:3-hydroxyacyl-CoA dehydrogenase